MIPPLTITLGSLEIGIAISTFLYGVTTIQAYVYSVSEHTDGLFLQLFVLCVWMSETGHTVFLWMYLYNSTVMHLASTPSAQIPWYFTLGGALGAFAGSLVQAFFAYRVKVISGKWWIAILAWCGAFLRLAIVPASGAVAARSASGTEREWFGFLIGHIVIDLMVDVWNTGSLCYYLAPNRKEYTRRTRFIVNKLMLWAIETGMMTWYGEGTFTRHIKLTEPSLVAVIWMIFAFVDLSDSIWLAIFMFYPKLYSISLLVSLNARTSLRKALDTGPTYHSVLWSQNAVIAASQTSMTETTETEMSPIPSRTRFQQTTATDDEIRSPRTKSFP